MHMVFAIGVIFGLVLFVISGLLKVLRALLGESAHLAPTLADSPIMSDSMTMPDSTYESGFSQSR